MRKPALRIAAHHSDPFYLLWYLVIVMISCTGWLLYTVVRALR
ncbi:MAG TPA: hypothetical protein VGF61_06210 [Candidatus Acidoferrum sp.]|jgi:hypothetical protein